MKKLVIIDVDRGKTLSYKYWAYLVEDLSMYLVTGLFRETANGTSIRDYLRVSFIVDTMCLLANDNLKCK